MPIDPGFPPGTIIENSNRVVRDTATGDLYAEREVIGSWELINQYREGYRCMGCEGVFTEPFPEECPHRDRSPGGVWKCEYKPKRDQARDFEAKFGGEGYWGPTPASVFDDEREREAWTAKPQILIPGRDF